MANNLRRGLSFDDVSLIPADFSTIKSRKDVDTSEKVLGYDLKLPIVASNMDSVFSPTLAREVARMGGISCVHRFCDIATNVKLFQDGIYQGIKPWVSVGVGPNELERADALVNAGAQVLVLDLANGACSAASEQFQILRQRFPQAKIVVGNFSTAAQINAFIQHSNGLVPDAFKLGQGNGSHCVTRLKTGIGYPSVSCIQDCITTGQNLIFDGGIRESGDLAKALALGCKAVFSGKLFAACEESGAIGGQWSGTWNDFTPETEKAAWEDMYHGKYKASHKKYRGSASASSYITQNKVASFRTPEGEESWVPITGTVQSLIENLDGGLRSSMTYLNSRDLKEFRKNANLIEISNSAILENKAYGKKD